MLTLTRRIGNLLKLFSPDSWAYVDDLIHTYGPVAKLHGILGVLFPLICATVALVLTESLSPRTSGCTCMTLGHCMPSLSRTRTRTYSVEMLLLTSTKCTFFSYAMTHPEYSNTGAQQSLSGPASSRPPARPTGNSGRCFSQYSLLPISGMLPQYTMTS